MMMVFLVVGGAHSGNGGCGGDGDLFGGRWCS
jgi:hypothetical protein